MLFVIFSDIFSKGFYFKKNKKFQLLHRNVLTTFSSSYNTNKKIANWSILLTFHTW